MSETGRDQRRAVRQLLSDWQSAGLSHLQVEYPEASSPTPLSKPEHAESEEAEVNSRAATASAADPESPVRETSPLAMSASAMTRPQREAHLQQVADMVSRCTRCPELAEARTQTVFGVGNPEAEVMFVGEAPGADEDAQGEPFVGRAGQLLNKIIEACGWKRHELYICNILRCRPPGNRNPTPQEAANCREYLDQQIQTVDPEFIVCWGSVAAHSLLDQTTAIGKMRQKWFKYGRAKVLCTYHPSYLLRNPAAKKPVWDDMKFLLAEMGQAPPSA